MRYRSASAECGASRLTRCSSSRLAALRRGTRLTRRPRPRGVSLCCSVLMGTSPVALQPQISSQTIGEIPQSHVGKSLGEDCKYPVAVVGPAPTNQSGVNHLPDAHSLGARG